MKTKEVLRRISAIESWISKVKERSSPPIQELLRDAAAAVARAKKAVRALSVTAKNRPAKSKQRPSKVTSEGTKPKRKVSAPVKTTAPAVVKKKRAPRRAVAKKLARAPKKAAGRKVTAPRATAAKAKKAPAREVEKASAKRTPVITANAPARKGAKSAPTRKAAFKVPPKKDVMVVQEAETPAPPVSEATTVIRPDQVAPEAPIQERKSPVPKQ
jgi:hypothetical protein